MWKALPHNVPSRSSCKFHTEVVLPSSLTTCLPGFGHSFRSPERANTPEWPAAAVVFMLVCPMSSWTVRMSYPARKSSVAKLWRKVWHPACFTLPKAHRIEARLPGWFLGSRVKTLPCWRCAQ